MISKHARYVTWTKEVATNIWTHAQTIAHIKMNATGAKEIAWKHSENNKFHNTMAN